VNDGNAAHLSLTNAGRQALARIAELEGLLLEDQALRAKTCDEMAKLKASSCLDVKCCASCEGALRAAVVSAIGPRMAPSDANDVASAVVAAMRERP
jgi:hypothetical protein